MPNNKDQSDLELIEERFKILPPVVQKAIVSADINSHLRELATTHKLHLDQWQSLENQVKFTLLGVLHSEELAQNIKTEVGVDDATAAALAEDISKVVFEPIRQELERQLEHPDAQAAASSGVEDMRTQMLKQNTDDSSLNSTPISVPVAPMAPTPIPTPEITPIAPLAAAISSSTPAQTTPTPSESVSTPVQTQTPSTPPAPKPTERAVRAPLSSVYEAAQPSTARKVIDGDPYREQIN